MPKVSVIIPTYNYCRHIMATMNSVLGQTLRDIEVIVVDDGSTDDTERVIRDIDDDRVRYLYKKNRGTSSARNVGLSNAMGEYAACLDHDDLWPENYLEVMVSRMDANPEYGLVYSLITVRYPDGTEIRSYKRPEGKSGWLTVDLFKRNFIWPSAAILRRSVLGVLRFDETLGDSYEDGDFFPRLSLRAPFLFVEDVEGIRQEHEGTLSAKTGVLPIRILILERFYYRLGGGKIVPATVAHRKMSHACRKVAKDRRAGGGRSAALVLYKRSIRHWPFDLRLYVDLIRTLLLNRREDPEPNWRMPGPLGPIGV